MNRQDLFRYLIQRNAYRSYLEIGCETDRTFAQVELRRKVGVDPRHGGTLRMTSDEFFAQNREAFDLVFVDGLHLCEQVLRDVDNAVRCLTPGGCIVLHDCLPTERRQQFRERERGAAWTGDVWKAVVELRQRAEYDLAVLGSDWGLGVLFVRPNSNRLDAQGELTWETYTADRVRLLRIVDDVGIKRFIDVEAVTGVEPVAGLVPIVEVSGMALAAGGGLVCESDPISRNALASGSSVDWCSEPDASAFRLMARTRESGCGGLLAVGGGSVCGSSAEAREPLGQAQWGKSRPLTIAFAHAALGQFEPLHQFLNQSGWANSFLFCTEGNHRLNQARVPNLVPYQPHGNKLSEPQSFYHLGRVEAANRRSLGLRKALREFQKRQPVDLLVAHVTMGSPSLLFDEFEFPIVSYVEFPSFRHHGWDERYPPTEGQQLRDKNFEMLATHCVLKSDHTIVPSVYARSMFPTELQPRISVLMEGFPLNSERWSQNGILPKETGCQYVGFAARDLSSAKGFEQFVRIANRVAAERPHVRFVVLGSEKVPYSYEDLFLDAKLGKGHGQSFRDWVLDQERADRSRFLIPGLVDYDTFSRYVNDIDLFLYPLQFGSGNWGLFELLGRGKIVIGSNRCFVPEVITHDVNGLLCDYDDFDGWVRLTLEVLDNLERHRVLGDTARRTSLRYSIDRVATEFLTLCKRLVRS